MMAKKKRSAVTCLRVKQIRSGIGFDRTQKGTLAALGLGKLGRTRVLPDNPQVRGMIAKIPHLVLVDEAGE